MQKYMIKKKKKNESFIRFFVSYLMVEYRKHWKNLETIGVIFENDKQLRGEKWNINESIGVKLYST